MSLTVALLCGIIILQKTEVDIKMIYKPTSPLLRELIDKYKTGCYGEDATAKSMECSQCGGEISAGNSYFMLDDCVYCMDCRETAHEHILRDVADSYIYEL